MALNRRWADDRAQRHRMEVTGRDGLGGNLRAQGPDEVTRLGYVLTDAMDEVPPVGGDLECADEPTLGRAFDGRRLLGV